MKVGNYINIYKLLYIHKVVKTTWKLENKQCQNQKINNSEINSLSFNVCLS